MEENDKCINLGALNKKTNKYVFPFFGNKQDEYICPDCKNDLIFCKGQVIRPYFRHHQESSCFRYSSPSESQIHKDAKLLLKELLEKKIPIFFYIGKCIDCNKNVEEKIVLTGDDSQIKLEYSFPYNNTTMCADVAYLKDKKLEYIFEICHTHKTKEECRPEPWFEINATSFINFMNRQNNLENIKLYCQRQRKKRPRCKECLDKITTKEEYNIKEIIYNLIPFYKTKYNDILDKKNKGRVYLDIQYKDKE